MTGTDERRPTFWQDLRAEAWVIGVLIVLSLVAEHLGLFRPFETTALDVWLRIKEPIIPRFVKVVAVTDADYRHVFHQTSPLNRQEVVQIIQKIADAKPLVIGVDLDTSDKSSSNKWNPNPGNETEDDRKFRTSLDALLQNKTPIIWAQSFEQEEGSSELKPSYALGGRDLRPDQTAIAAFMLDWDGVIRRYRRVVQTTEGSKNSLAWQVVRTAATEAGKMIRGGAIGQGRINQLKREPTSEPITLSFAADRYNFEPISVSKVDTKRGELSGKVVLVGQDHRLARDEYMTPVGVRSGLEIVAQTVESELQGLGIQPFRKWIMISFDLLGAILIVALQHYLGWRPAFWTSIAVIPAVAIIGSYAAFSSLAYWANFVPVLFCVLAHKIDKHMKHYRKVCRELESLRRAAGSRPSA